MDNNPDGTIEGTGFIHSNTSIINNGTVSSVGTLHLATKGFVKNFGVIKNAPLDTLRVSQLGESEPIKNKGMIEVNAGGGVAFNGELNNEPNGVIKLKNGVIAAALITHSEGATLEGFGGITGDLVMQANSLVKLTDPTYIIGDLYIGPGAELQISEGTTIITGKTTCQGNINLTGGKIVHQGGID